MSELSDWRVKVDDLHLILADAYAKRFSYVQEIAKFKDQKKSVWDIQRENFIFTQTLLKFSKNEVYFIATLIESQMNLAKLNYPQWNERKHLSKKNKDFIFWEKLNPLAVKICEPKMYKKLCLKQKIRSQLEGI